MKNPLLLVIIAAISLVVMLNSLYTMQETEQAMVLRFGKIEKLVTEPGLHAKVPFVQQVLFFDKRILETDSSPEEVQSFDKKRVVVDSFTRWRIVDAEKFYKAVRTVNSAISRLNTIVNSNIRRVVARESLMQLVSGERDRIMDEIRMQSDAEAQHMGIEIVDVRIKRADLPEDNSRAVFRRMHAERAKEAKEIRATGAEEAQKIRASAEKERTILLAESERDGQKMMGEGDAKSIKITGLAFNKSPKFYSFIRSLEAYRKSLSTGTTMVLSPDSDFMRVFDGE